MTARKLVPLSGIVAVVLIVVSFIVAGETPDTDDSIEEVVSFYTENDSDQMAGAILLGYGALFFLIFASTLRNALRKGEDGAGASTLGFGGAILFVAGATIFAGIGFTLGDAADNIDESSLHTLHVLNNDMFLTVAVGLFAFLLGTGIAVLRTGVLPAWLGWVAIVASVLAITPIFFIGFAVMGLWVLIVSVLLSLRAEDGTPAAAQGP
jgi:hypothetical protein